MDFISWDYLPPETRMLLTSDGSTTTLLEALVGEELFIRVSSQEQRLALDFPAETAVFPGLSEGSVLLARSSQLRTRRGDLVSDNLVLAPIGGTALGGLMDDRQAPLGRGMVRLGMSQSRRLISVGLDRWQGESGSGHICARKTYTMMENGRPVMYIAERFNPVYAPVRTEDRARAAR
ncbi:hypothetical protein [Streptomyces sp. NBC_01190]|uniref:hypothetical protein n=1 Tax=Streptomyces sp. NBC_01190 TaxID=2903767 RepID=UPI00386B5B54|nr:hypothetical protein OG519_26850 [Streptomyces sp. NBC_01190]